MLWKLIRQTVRVIRTRIRRITTDKLYLRKVTIPKYSLGHRRFLKLRYYFSTIFSFSLHPKYYKNIIKLLPLRPKIKPSDVPQNIIIVQDFRINPFPRFISTFSRTGLNVYPFERLPFPSRQYFHLRYRTFYSLLDLADHGLPYNPRRRQV